MSTFLWRKINAIWPYFHDHSGGDTLFSTHRAADRRNQVFTFRIWLITMQMKPHSLWIRHTVQLQPIITEADASVWLTSEQRERERTNWCGGRWDAIHIAEKWKEEGTVLIWQSEWLHIRNTAITHEDEKSERRRRETRRGKDNLLPRGDWEKSGSLHSHLLVFPVLYILF